jgi:hypothetical protein
MNAVLFLHDVAIRIDLLRAFTYYPRRLRNLSRSDWSLALQ